MGRRWVVYGNYTGPGNPLDRDYVRSHPPVDDLDRASFRHDLAYSRLGKRAYWRGSAADVQFLKDVWASKPASLKGKLVKAGALGFFGVKNAISAAVGASLTRKDEMRSKRSVTMAGSRSSRMSAKRQRTRYGPRRLGTGTTGSYVGRLKRPLPAAPPGKYAVSGFRGHRELYGQQTASDVVYIGIPSMRVRDIGVAVGAAFWRRILKRHCGINIANPLEVINWGRVTNAISDPAMDRVMFLRRYRTNAGTTVIDAPYEQLVPRDADVTLMDLAKEFCENVFMSANASYFGANPTDIGLPSELYGYQCRYRDVTVQVGSDPTTVVMRDGPVVLLDTQRVSVYQLVKLAVQNVTVADASGDGDARDADRIDRNPLVGRLFKFSTPHPVARNPRGVGGQSTGQVNVGLAPNNNFLDIELDMNGDGLILPSSNLTSHFAQVPDAHAFKKCVGVANVTLEPGNMKDVTIKFKFNGTINRLMKGCAYRMDTIAAGVRADYEGIGFGQCLLLAMEKRMSTGSTSVTLNYQYDTWYGACFGKSSRTYLQPYTTGGNLAQSYVGIVNGEPGKDNAT